MHEEKENTLSFELCNCLCDRRLEELPFWQLFKGIFWEVLFVNFLLSLELLISLINILLLLIIKFLLFIRSRD